MANGVMLQCLFGREFWYKGAISMGLRFEGRWEGVLFDINVFIFEEVGVAMP